MKIKILSIVFIIMFFPVILNGCKKNKAEISEPVQTAKTSLGIKYAKNFSIVYMENDIKLVTDSAGSQMLLVPKGTEVPSGYNNAVLIETPIENSMYTSTTFIGFLSALEDDSLYDSITIVCTPLENWTNPKIIERFKEGETHFIDHGQTSVGSIEEIIKINPGIVFIGNDDVQDMQLRNLLDEVSIKQATILEWTEEGPNAYLEWIKFFAAFFNIDREADRIFEAKLAELDELYKLADNAAEKPSVAYAVIWRGAVYTQPGNSAFARQIERAGGTYALKELDGTGGITISMEEFFNRCRNADIVIYGSLPQYLPDKSFLLETEPLMAEFSAFRNDRIYIFDQGYFMNNIKVIERFTDLISIIQPSLFPGRELVMYQKLFP